MADITINDLVESRELTRGEMTRNRGGLAALYLHSFPITYRKGSSFPGVINNYYLTQLFADTIQLNQQTQIIEVTDSPAANISVVGTADNSLFA